MHLLRIDKHSILLPVYLPKKERRRDKGKKKKRIELSGVSLANVEALASGEGDYSQKIWERFYRPDCTGYNCTKTGNETC